MGRVLATLCWTVYPSVRCTRPLLIIQPQRVSSAPFSGRVGSGARAASCAGVDVKAASTIGAMATAIRAHLPKTSAWVNDHASRVVEPGLETSGGSPRAVGEKTVSWDMDFLVRKSA